MADSDLAMQCEAQGRMIEQLKSMIREREESIKAKDKELQVNTLQYGLKWDIYCHFVKWIHNAGEKNINPKVQWYDTSSSSQMQCITAFTLFLCDKKYRIIWFDEKKWLKICTSV